MGWSNPDNRRATGLIDPSGAKALYPQAFEIDPIA
jgi:hypothetical protein